MNKKAAARWWFIGGLLGVLAVTLLLQDAAPKWVVSAIAGGIGGGCFTKALMLEKAHRRDAETKE